jgi:D-alanyl-D-alanine carboxypeptidase/D-alanyl-D-alanine-endopeptidase (penicillin-binding protein 4)
MMQRRRLLVAVLAWSAVACSPLASAVLPGPSGQPVRIQPADPRPPIERHPVAAPWTAAIDRIVGGQSVSVAVGIGRRLVYQHLGDRARLPASNQKLVLSMAALDTFGPSHRFVTVARPSHPLRLGVLAGDLWLIGSGDPELTPAGLSVLADSLHDRGLRTITGSVVGDVAAFDRRWWAPGWIRGLSRHYVARPTALSLHGNAGLSRPELSAATALTDALRSSGVTVAGSPRTGRAPAHLQPPLAQVRSAPLADILLRQNHGSINFDAEMLTEALGARVSGSQGSTRGGAAAMESWASHEGVRLRAFDGSGLSHRDRVSTVDLVTLLLDARREPWGHALITSMPSGGEGTLGARLAGVPVHAKTGTLFVTPVSALSGYVRTSEGRLVAFSVLSRGLSKSAAVEIEDAVVRTIAGARLR